jgi:cysteine desulfurase
VRPEVADAMREALAGSGANPSSSHREGQHERARIERAREQVAALVHARPEQVVFTSGGTEGDHLALIGAAWGLRERGKTVAISSIEHHAVHGAAAWLKDIGFTIEHLPVRPDGMTDPSTIDDLPERTSLVSLMLANNETGVLQPVAGAAARAHARGIRLHCDAVQGTGKMPVDAGALDADYLVISAHKIGGPKGVGAVIVRNDAPLSPLLRGSGHEGGRRGGTENLPGIVGFGRAAELALRDLAGDGARLLALRERFESGVRAIASDAVIHGTSAPRLPNTVNVSIPGARSDHLLMALDAEGVAVSAGAACASGGVEPSPVLAAMGVPREIAICALRFSSGRTTTEREIDDALAALARAVPKARALAPA